MAAMLGEGEAKSELLVSGQSKNKDPEAILEEEEVPDCLG